jgi:hypothetical protein
MLHRVAADQIRVPRDAGGIASVLVLEDGPDCFLPDNIVVPPDRRGLGCSWIFWRR